jgi:outer membrane lipoprotein SlyB
MFRPAMIALSMVAVTVPATVALAKPPPWAPANGYRAKDGSIRYRQVDGVRYWRGADGQYHCKRSNGTVGLLIGAALGALLGRAIDTRGERVTGTVVGAAAGAIVGREIERGRTRCR